MIQVLNSQCSLDWFKAKSRGNHCFSMFFSWNLGLSCNFSSKSMNEGPEVPRTPDSEILSWAIIVCISALKSLNIHVYMYRCIYYILQYSQVPSVCFPCLELSLPATYRHMYSSQLAPLQAAKSFKIGHQVLTDTKWGHLTVTFVGS